MSETEPPPPTPVHWPQPPTWTPPPPPRTNRKPWLILGASTLTAIALIATLIIWRTTTHTDNHQSRTTTTTATAAAPPATRTNAPTTAAPTPTLPPVTAAQLGSLLLNTAAIDAIMGPPDVQPGIKKTQMEKSETALSNPNCLGALDPRMEPVYAGSGYTAMSAQVFNASRRLVDEGAVVFAAAEQADAFLQSSAAKWRACAGQSVIETYPHNERLMWIFGNVIGDAPRISQLDSTQERGVPCQHAMVAVSNVVIDVSACSPQINDEASRIADAMADNVPKR